MRRWALWMMRPAREKKRRQRVLVMATGSPSPMRVVQHNDGMVEAGVHCRYGFGLIE